MELIALIRKMVQRFLALLNAPNSICALMAFHIYSNVQKCRQEEGCTLIQHWINVIGLKKLIVKLPALTLYKQKQLLNYLTNWPVMSIAPMPRKERKFLAQQNAQSFMSVVMGKHIDSNVQRCLQEEGYILIQNWMYAIGHKKLIVMLPQLTSQ